jgi:mono/diheme cytochrome c family protein
MKRGKNRFEIYCTPCHGHDGRGTGAVPTRVALTGGAWQARNLVDAGNPVAIHMPNGQLFNTISNGYNTMMGYAAQIPHADRWAIVLYVRALQRSQNAALDDVPADHRSAMQMPEAPQ